MARLIPPVAAPLLLCLLVQVALAGSPGEIPPPSSLEYQMKAAFLYNFAKFVEWPARGSGDRDGQIRVCILGKDPFGPVLEGVIQGKTVNNRSLAVRRIAYLEGATSCHLLFIGSSEKNRLEDIVEALKGTNVLTVSEIDRFAHRGGMINFLMENKKVRFEINVDAAALAGLKISSKLLQLATIVRQEGSGGKRQDATAR